MIVRRTLAVLSLPALIVLVAGSGVSMRAERPDFVSSPVTALPVLTAIVGAAEVGPSPTVGRVGTVPPETHPAPTSSWVELVPPQMPAQSTIVPTEPCDLAAFLAVVHAPPGGWDAAQMVRYMLRETGNTCDPTLRSSTSDTGLWQINDINLPYLRRVLGEWVDRWTLMDPVQNVRAAAALCEFWRAEGAGCYQPWK